MLSRRGLNAARARCLLPVFLLAAVIAPAAGHAADTAPPTLAALLGSPAGLKVNGSVRLRQELLSGQPRAGLAPSTDLFSTRTTFFAEYTWDRFRLGGELYDSRAYPERPRSGVGTSEVNTLEPVQLYVAMDLKDALGAGSRSALQAGRFTLNLGSRRLVAADDYRNTTNGYTGVRFDWRGASNRNATFTYTLPQSRQPDALPAILDNDIELDREGADTVLWGGIVAWPLASRDALEFSHFRLVERDRRDAATRDRDLATSAIRAFRDPAPGRPGYEVEGIYQRGSLKASTAPLAPTLDASAWFIHVEAGYQWESRLQTRLSLEYDYASGDDRGQDFGRFDTLYGMRRADLAPSGIYAAIGRANLSAPGIRLEVAPSNRWDAMMTVKGLWLASRTDSFATTGVRDATGGSGSHAGEQVDVRVRYWLVPQALRFEADGMWLRKGRFLETAPNAPDTRDTRYLSLNLTATF